MKKLEVRICSHHQEKEKTPLIWTFAFNGSEYWCPACGANYGMLGAGDIVNLTKTLERRLSKYTKLSSKFLKAKGLLVCSSFEHKGEQRKFSEMSQRFKTYWINRSKEWKYKYD